MKKIIKTYYVLDDDDVKQIKKQMIDNDLNFNKLADKLGVSRSYISSIINKKRNITERVVRLLKASKIYIGDEVND